MTPLVEERIDEIERLCREHDVARLELFGSAASGEFRPGESDLDFLVSFEPRPAGSRPAPYFRLAAALQDLFGMDVDLVEERPSAIRTSGRRSTPAPGRPSTSRRLRPSARRSMSPIPLRSAPPWNCEPRNCSTISTRPPETSFRFTDGKTLDDYLDDLLLRRAVEREFEIIGEAATRLGRQDRATLERITALPGDHRFPQPHRT